MIHRIHKQLKDFTPYTYHSVIMSIISPRSYSYVVNRLRNFFLKRGFLEVHTQNRLSILAACEDPTTISTFFYLNNKWPLPQTGQMWLEWEMLNDPRPAGYFCVSTSYRQEPRPIPGRHEMIFPMFEFEQHGGVEELRQMECELLRYLGYGTEHQLIFNESNYSTVASAYETKDVTSDHENRLYTDHGSVFFLRNFPEYTSPFWNMARNEDGTAKKIDVILSGQETIGSAERCCDKDEMRHRFNTISGGEYSRLLYNTFGKDRVDKELNDFLRLPFIRRSGGGIGLTRLIRSLSMEGLMPKQS